VKKKLFGALAVGKCTKIIRCCSHTPCKVKLQKMSALRSAPVPRHSVACLAVRVDPRLGDREVSSERLQ
jgi:hypothetical protein